MRTYPNRGSHVSGWILALGLAACGTPGEPPEAPAATAQPSPPGASAEPAPVPVPALLVGDVELTPAELEGLFEFSPLPEPPDDPTNAYDTEPAAARLGQFLFFDSRLSSSGELSCSTCHDPAKGWSDGRRTSLGAFPVPRHASTLWNAAYQRWLFWDGRRDTLWAQALAPLEDRREHAITRVQVARLVAGDPELARAYEEVFGALPEELSHPEDLPERARPVPDRTDDPDSVAWRGLPVGTRDAVNRVFSNVGKALAAFERRIVSRRAPFDVFVEGVREADPERQAAIDDAARRGYRLFVGKGRCNLCHSGPTFSDLEFHDNRVPPLEAGDETDPGRFRGIGQVLEDPFNGLGGYSDAPDDPVNDKLRYLARNQHNLREFKTPSLRNVATTAPYMHEGQIATLEDVVEYYSSLATALPEHHERRGILRPADLDAGEKADLLAFLRSLTDTRIDPELTRPPPSPLLPGSEDPR